MSDPPPAAGPWWRGRLVRGAKWLAAAYLGLLAVLMYFENALIFPAPKYPEGEWNPVGLGHEEVRFESSDGVPLHGWFVEADEPRGVVLYCHGNGDCVGYLAEYLRFLRDELQLSVFAFDYRGYGRSEGSPDEQGVLADAEAASQWLAQRTRLPQPKHILWGRSLGGAVAIHLAAKGGARLVVLESTFSSMPDVAQRLYWFLPVRWAMRTRFDSVAKAADYGGPTLQVHGGKDDLVGVDLAQRLHDALPGPKRWLLDESGGHNTPPPPRFYDELLRLLEAN